MPTAFSPAVHGVSMSEALREAAMHAPADVVVLATYEFVHPSFTARALVVNDYNALEAKTETGDSVRYEPCAALRVEGFTESDQAQTPTLKLNIDGVSSILTDKLDLAIKSMVPVQIIERIYVSTDLTTPAMLPPAKVLIRSGSVSETRVTVEAGIGDPANQPFPRITYTRKEHPGLSTQ